MVVGRTGLAWGVGFDDVARDGPHKHEGDGKSPAGVFPLDTAFGFAPPQDARDVRLPYVQLMPGTDCVDDTTSAHYNTVIDRDRAARVDWNSAEHMRDVGQYRIGVIIGYNAAPPVAGRGSCIFLHIWNGPASVTAGCTAFDATELARVIAWLDPTRQPALVQLTAAEYTAVPADHAVALPDEVTDDVTEEAATGAGGARPLAAPAAEGTSLADTAGPGGLAGGSTSRSLRSASAENRP